MPNSSAKNLINNAAQDGVNDPASVVTLHHGNGGRQMQELLAHHLFPLLDDPHAGSEDAATFNLRSSQAGQNSLGAMTTDSFVVDPLFFPGGDIGRLSICGTVNDLATSGAAVQGISLGLILEEGLPLNTLDRVLASLAATAREAAVKIITGDTKVVPHGLGGGIYINTAAFGVVTAKAIGSAGERLLSQKAARPGDEVVLTGPVGNHELALMQVRHHLDLPQQIQSDVAPLNLLAQQLIEALPAGDLHVIKDPTRGGVVSALTEIATQAQCQILLNGELPLDAAVRAACDLLGLDPWYLANEGKYILIGKNILAAAQAIWPQAAVIGRIENGLGRVLLTTESGSRRPLLPLEVSSLPRIC